MVMRARNLNAAGSLIGHGNFVCGVGVESMEVGSKIVENGRRREVGLLEHVGHKTAAESVLTYGS